MTFYAEKIITATEPIDIDVKEVTLLSIEEYWKHCHNIPKLVTGTLDDLKRPGWWLRSAGSGREYAAYIFDDGPNVILGHCMVSEDNAVRPVIKVSDKTATSLKVGNELIIARHRWTVIGEGMLIANEPIGTHCFRENHEAVNARIYEKSNIRKWLKRWAEENGLLAEGVIV